MGSEWVKNALNAEQMPNVRFRIVETNADAVQAAHESPIRPIILYAHSAEFQAQSPADIVDHLRDKSVTNPLVYFSPDAVVDLNARLGFEEATGDVIVDKDDLGPIADDPLRVTLLKMRVNALYFDKFGERKTKEIQGVNTYGRGIVHAVTRDSETFAINGQVIPITSQSEKRILKEFLILEKKRREHDPGLVITSEMFLQQLYSDPENPELLHDRKSTLAQFIRRINNKLKPFGFSMYGYGGPSSHSTNYRFVDYPYNSELDPYRSQ